MTMLFIAVCLACVIYSRSIRGGFLFDDHAISDMDFPRREAIILGIIDFDDPGNRASPPASIDEIFARTGGDGRSWFRTALRSFFLEPRSLTHLGYYWTWKLDRLEPSAWHSVNLYIHCANIWLVYLFAKLFLPVYPAGIAALIFAVHPLQVAAVAYISGRAGVQCTFFSLAAVLIGAGPVSLWTLPGFFLAVTFAMRSKEDAPLWLMLFGTTYAVYWYFFGLI